MPAVMDDFMHRQLLDRRERLEIAASRSKHANAVHNLLADVDAALAKMEEGSFGICELCHEPLECERLLADPLVRICLDHLSNGERRALERDLELAAEVQRGLLPQNDLTFPGWRISYHYEPAGLVSGDYCDVVDQGEAGLYFMVGDVSGKGVAASMLMAHLHAMFRTLISVGLSLKCMLEHASNVFSESTLPTHYATLVCGRALPDGRVEISNAGHPPPLICRDGHVAALEGSSLPVGIFCHEEFTVEEICLEPGHSMLIYSDGVSEATGADGAAYGSDRLCQLLSNNQLNHPADLIAACRDDLKSYRRGQRSDDVTLFALGRACA